MQEQQLHSRGHNHSPSYNSAESGGPSLHDPQPGTSVNLSHSPPPSPGSKSARALQQPYESPLRDLSRFSPHKVGRAIASRAVRAARRGNLPFLVIFLRYARRPWHSFRTREEKLMWQLSRYLLLGAGGDWLRRPRDAPGRIWRGGQSPGAVHSRCPDF